MTANTSFDKQEEHFLVWNHQVHEGPQNFQYMHYDALNNSDQEKGLRCTLSLAFENGEGRNEIWDKIQSIQNHAFSPTNQTNNL